ncbi:MAG: preprotein translocase subunit SecG [Crocinitomicaceae bacterium]
MDAILSILVLLASVLLIFVVYIQNPKGGGLSSDFGSPGQLGGVKKTNEFIDKLTWSLAGIIVVASIIITMRQPKAKKVTDAAKAQTEQGQSQQETSE